MRTFVILIMSCLGGFSQVPSFKSFNPTQFSTNNFIISVKDGAPLTNINGITTINLNGTNIINLFSPASLTNQIYWTNISTVLQPGGSSVINSVQVTNFTSFQTLASAGAFILDTTFATTLNFGNNCISPLQQGGLALTGQSTDPNDTILYIDGGNFNGHLLFIMNASTNSAFTMLNGAPFCDFTPDAFVRLNGDWVTQTQGDGLLLYNFNGQLWTEVGRMHGSTNVISGDNVWENVSGNIRPVNGNENNVLRFTSGLANNATNIALRVGTTNLWDASGSLLAAFHTAGTNQNVIAPLGGIGIGRFTEWWGNLSSESMISVRDQAIDGSSYNAQYLVTRNSTNTAHESYIGKDVSLEASLLSISSGTNNVDQEILLETKSGAQSPLGPTVKMKVSGTDRVSLRPAVTSSGSAVAHLLDTSNVLTNGDTFLSIRNAGTPIFQFTPAAAGNPAGQIVWGPGATNVLFRSDRDLHYTNGATAVYFKVESSTGTAELGTTTAGHADVRSSTTDLIFTLNGSSPDMTLTSVAAALVPNISLSLGSTAASQQWQNLRLAAGGKVNWNGSTNTVFDIGVSGTPEGATTGDPGSIARDWVNGAAYVKVTGAGNTGWQKLATTGTGAAIQAEYLDADETNDTVTPDNLALSATVIAAGKYAFTLTVFLDNSTDADGAVIDFNGGDATMTSFRAQAKAFDSALVLSTQTTTLDGDISVTTLTGAGSVEVSGGFTVNAAGTFIPRFFMEADSGGTLTAFRNSTMVVTTAQ